MDESWQHAEQRKEGIGHYKETDHISHAHSRKSLLKNLRRKNWKDKVELQLPETWVLKLRNDQVPRVDCKLSTPAITCVAQSAFSLVDTNKCWPMIGGHDPQHLAIGEHRTHRHGHRLFLFHMTLCMPPVCHVSWRCHYDIFPRHWTTIRIK